MTRGDDPLVIGGVRLASRLLLGSGGFRDAATLTGALRESRADVVTIAVRRTHDTEPGLLRSLAEAGVRLLPNTAGCHTAEQAVTTARLAREAFATDWVKLEVIGDPRTLMPDAVELLAAARALVADGFTVLAYTNDDPVLGARLEQLGCAAVMPLGAPIGSGLGIRNPHAIELMREAVSVPLILDAGIGTASDAARALELGCDGVLAASAVSRCAHPLVMADALRHAVIAGRRAYLAGRIPARHAARASTQEAGLPQVGA